MNLKQQSIGWTLAAILLAPAAPSAAKGDGEVEILGRDPLGAPTFLTGALGQLDPDAPEASAAALLKNLTAAELGATGGEVLTFERLSEDHLGGLHLRYREEIFDLPVDGAELIVHADADGAVFAVTGRFAALRDDLAREPELDAAQAIETAAVEAKILGWKQEGKALLTYVIGQWDGLPHLAWRALVDYTSADGPELDYLYSDAVTGQLVRWNPTIRRAGKNWETYSAGNNPAWNALPGTLVCTNGQSCGLPNSTARRTDDNTSTVYDYYDQRFGRDSIDDACMTLQSTVNFGVAVANSFWFGTGEQTVFGDGGSDWKPFGKALDVVAHEWTHGMTFYGPNFNGSGESSALDEGYADVFAAAIETWAAGGNPTADTWTLGESINLTPTPPFIRSLSDPASSHSPGVDYYPDYEDHLGPHRNSGILSLAFQLMVEGGSHPRGQTFNPVPAMGMNSAEQVFYDALDFLGELSGFREVRAATELAAEQSFGANSPEVESVREAWCAVGLTNLVSNFGYDLMAGGWRVDKHPRFTADVTGDGRDDIVGFGGAGVYVAESKGTCFGPPRLWINNFGYDANAGGWRVDKHPRMLADVNNDDKLDVVGFGGAGVYVALSTGVSFAPAQLWINDFGYDTGYRIDKHPRMTADIDNDGDDDIVAFGGAGVYVAKSTGTGLAPAQLWINDFGYDLGYRIDKHPRMMADIDNDGDDDVIAFGGAGVYVAKSGGTSFAPAQLWVGDFGYDMGYRTDKHPRMMANVDGAHGDDVIAFGGAGVYVALANANGNGFGPVQLWINDFGYDTGYRIDLHPRMMADTDGDGKDDVVAYGGAGPYIAISTGAAFNQAALRVRNLGLDQNAGGWRTDKHPRMTGDMDGNGRADIVGFGGAGVFLYFN